MVTSCFLDKDARGPKFMSVSQSSSSSATETEAEVVDPSDTRVPLPPRRVIVPVIPDCRDGMDEADDEFDEESSLGGPGKTCADGDGRGRAEALIVWIASSSSLSSMT